MDKVIGKGVEGTLVHDKITEVILWSEADQKFYLVKVGAGGVVETTEVV